MIGPKAMRRSLGRLEGFEVELRLDRGGGHDFESELLQRGGAPERVGRRGGHDDGLQAPGLQIVGGHQSLIVGVPDRLEDDQLDVRTEPRQHRLREPSAPPRRAGASR